MANFLPPAVIEIKAIADKAIAEFKQVNGELEKMEKEADKAGGGINRMEQASKVATGVLIGLGTAFAGFAAIGIKEAMEAEKIMAKLGSTMTATGVNTEKNRLAVEKLSESYVQLGFDDEAAAAGFENLLRVTGDLEKSQQLLALSADLARTKNIGLTEASAILAKASTGNAKAFKEAGIVLDTTIPRAEAVAKAFDELNDKIGTQAENATKTFAVQLQIVKEQFNNTAQALGTALLPVLKSMLEKINQGVEFVKRHSDAFKVLGGIFLTVTVALAAYNATVKVQMALTKAWSVVTGIQAAVTKLLTGQQVALNTAMKLNPIGLVVSAAMLLVGAFVLLWNKSEAFRKGVIAVGKAGLMAFASIIPIVGKVGEAMLKFIMAPLKGVLTALSKLPGVGKYAKAGLDILNKGLDGVSDFADKASAKAKELAGNLDKLNKPIKIDFGGDGGIPDLGKGTGKGKSKGGLTPEEKKKIEKQNEDYMKIVKDLNEKVEAAKKKYNETIAKAQKVHDEKVADANKRYNESVAKANQKAAEDTLNAQKKRDEGILKAEKEAAEKRKAAQEAFNNTMGKLNTKRADDLEKLEKDNAKRVQEIYKANAEKLQAIVQQSINRLRDAYKSGTSFSVTELFKGLAEAGKRSADDLLSTLKNKLAGAQQLAANASKLAGLGFSQTFIEQVVSAGPEVGNELADSILKATPETITELQKTFLAMENQTNNGLNQLANSMNAGGRLATEELNKAYADAQAELTEFLAVQAEEYAARQAEINKDFNEQMAEAEKIRDEAFAKAEADLAEQLAEIQKQYNESIAEIDKELNNALAEASRDLNEALAEAAKDLAEATAEARKELTETLDELAKEFNEKLGNIQNAIASTIAAINALKAAMASVGSMGGGGGGGGGGTTTTTATTALTTLTTSGLTATSTGTSRAVVADGSVASWRAGEEKSMAGLVINQTFNTDYVDPIQVKTQMLNAIKYGSTVQVTAPVGGGGGKYGMLVD
jgi:hypothetical protein